MNSKDSVFILQVLIALGSVAVFGALFMLMGYFELMGADPEYFDQGTYNNINHINAVVSHFGFQIDPNQIKKISTLKYAIALGGAFLVSSIAIMISNRRSNDIYEITEAKA